MKAEPAEAAETTGANSGAGLSDPFAVDLFASSRTHAARDALPTEDFQTTPTPRAPARPWHAALPRVSRADARRSSLLAALPPSLPEEAREALARVLSRLTRVPAAEVRLDAVGLHETTPPEFDSQPASERAPRAVLNFTVEPEGAPVVVALDADFAAAVVDRLLGGDGAPPPSLRPLSPTECAVIEFFCLCVVRELNTISGEPLFRLESVTDALPPKLWAPKAAGDNSSQPAGGEGVEADARLLVMTIRVALGSTVGLARLAFDEDALAALGVANNPLLARAGGEGERFEKRLAAFKRVAADVPLRLLVGETHIDALNLSELEGGDIVIVERQLLSGVGGGRVDGRLLLHAGAGRGVVIAGGATASRVGDAGAFALVVESVRGGGGRAEVERVDMEDEEGLEAGAGASALEGLLMTLNVELPARRISLEELSRLRAGQILELGCRATDPVELVADGRRVAAGELVDIEGRLGVRVTRLLG